MRPVLYIFEFITYFLTLKLLVSQLLDCQKSGAVWKTTRPTRIAKSQHSTQQSKHVPVVETPADSIK